MKRNRLGPNALVTVIENDAGTRQARVEDYGPEARISLYQRDPGQRIWAKVTHPGEAYALRYLLPTLAEAERFAELWVEEACLPPVQAEA